jgi:O-antigen/teichoic acid export membrane protein
VLDQTFMLRRRTAHPDKPPAGFWRLLATKRGEDRDYFSTEAPTDLRRRTVRGSGVTMTAQVVKVLTGTVTLAIMARLLTPADYGIFAILLVVVGFAWVFSDLGLATATIQRPSLTHEEASALFWINAAGGIVLTLLVAASGPAIAALFGQPKLALALPAMATTFLFTGVAAQHAALLSRAMHFAAYSVADSASRVIGSAVGIGTAVAGLGYWSLVVMQIAVAASQMVIVMRLSRWWPTRPTRPFFPSDLVRFGGNVTGFSFINYFVRQGDNILIGGVYGSAQLGIYTRAYSLLLLPLSQILAPLDKVVTPALSRIGAHDAQRYRQAFLSVMGKLTLVTMPAMAFAIVNSHALVKVLLGDQWSESARIFAVLGFAGLIQPIGSATAWLFVTQGRTSQMLFWSAVTFPFNIGAYLIGLPFGPFWVATAYTVYYFLHLPAYLWFVCREGPVAASDIYRACFPAVITAGCAGVATLAARAVMHHSAALLQLLLSAPAALAAAAGALALLPSGRRQVQEARRAVLGSLRRRVPAQQG